jgi:hypothetical protein
MRSNAGDNSVDQQLLRSTNCRYGLILFLSLERPLERYQAICRRQPGNGKDKKYGSRSKADIGLGVNFHFLPLLFEFRAFNRRG